MKNKQLRRVKFIDDKSGEIYFFHHWVADPNTRLVAIIEDQKGKVGLAHYSRIQFIEEE